MLRAKCTQNSFKVSYNSTQNIIKSGWYLKPTPLNSYEQQRFYLLHNRTLLLPFSHYFINDKLRNSSRNFFNLFVNKASIRSSGVISEFRMALNNSSILSNHLYRTLRNISPNCFAVGVSSTAQNFAKHNLLFSNQMPTQYLKGLKGFSAFKSTTTLRTCNPHETTINSLKTQIQFNKLKNLQITIGSKTHNHIIKHNGIIAQQQKQLQSMKHRTQENSQKASHGIVTLWQKYGYIGIATYLTVYITTLGTFFFAEEFGILTADQIKRGVGKIPILRNHIDKIKLEKVDSPSGKFIVAWVVTKIFEPVRFFITLGITPFVVKYFKKFPL